MNTSRVPMMSSYTFELDATALEASVLRSTKKSHTTKHTELYKGWKIKSIGPTPIITVHFTLNVRFELNRKRIKWHLTKKDEIID